MHKKAHLRLKLKKGESAKVKKGDTVAHGDILAVMSGQRLHEFHLAELLKVKPAAVASLLIITENTPLKKGDIIAKKGGLLSKQTIKTPLEGTFVWVNKEQGIVGIKSDENGVDSLTAWFDGVVEEVTPEVIVVAVSGIPISGTAGRGGPATGKLLVVTEKIDVFSMPTDIESRVLAIPKALPDMIAKADALGVVAIIAEHIEEPPFTLPYLLIDNIAGLTKYQNKTVIVHGEGHELLIIENESSKPAKT